MKLKKLTQADDILKHLREHNGITQKEAINKYKVYRLSAVIFQLRKRGYRIGGRNEKTRTKHGRIATYTRYYLIPTEGN